MDNNNNFKNNLNEQTLYNQVNEFQAILQSKDQDKIKQIQNLLKNKQMPKNDECIYCVIVIGFHHKIGAQIEFIHSKTEIPENILKLIPYYALPDLCHLQKEDYVFFNLDNQYLKQLRPQKMKENDYLFGVSTFRQIDSTLELQEKDKDIVRNQIQKSVCILTNSKQLNFIQQKLHISTHAYFNQNDFQNYDVFFYFIQIFKELLNQTFNFEETNKSLFNITQFLKTKLFLVIKSILLEQNIVVYSKRPSDISDFIYGVLSMIPGYLQEIQSLGLNYFSDTYQMKMYCSIYDYADLDPNIKYLIGTTNQMIMENFKSDLVIDLEQQKVIIKMKKIKLTNFEKVMQSEIIKQKQTSLIYLGNDDWIKNKVHQYFKNFYNDIAFYGQNAEFKHQKEQPKNKITNLIDKFKENHIVKQMLINNQNGSFENLCLKYNPIFLNLWSKTKNFKQFINNHCQYISALSYENNFMLYDQILFNEKENELYYGTFKDQKPNGKGLLIKVNEYYEGDFLNGEWNGYGKFQNSQIQYTGEFKNNQFHGYGQKIEDDKFFSGEFKNDKKFGKGVLIQDDKRIEGYWMDDQIIDQ